VWHAGMQAFEFDVKYNSASVLFCNLGYKEKMIFIRWRQAFSLSTLFNKKALVIRLTTKALTKPKPQNSGLIHTGMNVFFGKRNCPTPKLSVGRFSYFF
jgi:hypothetical protein